MSTGGVILQLVTGCIHTQVVPGSGRGWQMFRVEGREGGSPGGVLRAVEPLDYEDPNHRRGFHFRVQVTDMVREALFVDIDFTHVLCLATDGSLRSHYCCY